MRADVIKTLVAHITAGVVIVSALFLVAHMVDTGQVSGDAGLTFIVGISGAAITFIFSQETARASRAGQEKAFKTGTESALMTPYPPPGFSDLPPSLAHPPASMMSEKEIEEVVGRLPAEQPNK